jgi:hypothetical protein
MQRVLTPAGITISHDRYGSGPALVLVHGSFSDHNTNWGFVRTARGIAEADYAKDTADYFANVSPTRECFQARLCGGL